MAYNPSLYNPYGSQQFQPTISYPQQYQPTMQPQYQQQFAAQQQQQPVNGLTFIDVDNLNSYWLPNGSVSQPLFIDDKHFIIKTFDKNGGSEMEAYEAKKIPLSSILKPNDNTVTKDDLDAFKAEIMEAINGRNSFADVQHMARQGYGGGMMGHGELIEKLGEEFRNMPPEERMMMKSKVLSIMGGM